MISITAFVPLLARLLGVVFTAVMLSGDNAVVIALAAGRLKGSERKRAIFFGAAGAVFLLLVFASVVTLLLQIPYFRVAGGFLLFYIAWKLVQEDEPEGRAVRGGESIWQAIRVIVVADVLMSLDNVLALIGVSGGNLWLLGVGLASTVPVVFWGSRLLIRVLERWGWLVYAGAALLGWVAINMVFSDGSVQRVAASVRDFEDPIEAAITAAFVLFCWLWARRRETVEHARDPGRKGLPEKR